MAKTKIPTRERILRAASELFLNYGYNGTSTRDIADQVGISQPGLYRHFESKAAILLAIADALLGPAAEKSKQEKEAKGKPAVRLCRLFSKFCADLAESPFNAALFLMDPALDDPAFRAITRLYARIERAVEALIAEGIKAAEFRPVHKGIARQALLSLTDILIFPTPGTTEAKISFAVDFGLRGLLADPSTIEMIIEEADAE